MPLRDVVSYMVIGCLAMPVQVTSAQDTYSEWQRHYGASRDPGGASSTPTTARPPAATSPAAPVKAEELEQIVAPVALYPDSLLAQVLMASTYPLEVVQADRWVKQNASLKNSPDALNKLTWDPSVKSLIDFPQVLTMMSEKLDWTVKLGDAFIADQKAVMDAVQQLRNKAYAQGNLKTTPEQNVKLESPPAAPSAAAAGTAPSPQVIVIESSNPSVVYVPTYNPTVVYGAWPYPAYPPYSYYPPGYVAGTAMLSFGLGVACGAAWGHAWGDCDWHGGDVEVDIDKNINYNKNINREKYKAERDARQTQREGNRDTRQADRQGRQNSFQHDPSHRQGVAYRDAATTERFRGGNSNQSAAQAREAYRGRAEAGRQDLARGGADGYRGSTGARTMDTRGSGAASARDFSGTRSSGFSGSSAGGASARAASNRGQASRSTSSYSAARGSGYSSGGSRSYSGSSRSGGYSGGARTAGGGMRGGGGGRGGGRR